MRISVTTELRFLRTPDGAVWTSSASPLSFWTRYLQVFDSVQVVARVQDVSAPQPTWKRADGERVSFAALPYYVGPLQYVRHARALKAAVRHAIRPNDAVLLRVASSIAAMLRPVLAGRPHALEVVGDPYDVFAPGASRHPLRAWFRWWFTRQLKTQCQKATAISYVTERTLQQRYHPNPAAFVTNYSSIELPQDAFAALPKAYRPNGKPLRIATIGSLEQPYKGIDVLIDAAATCIHDGLPVEVSIIGDGQYRIELEQQAAQRGISDSIHFLGMLPAGEAVRAQLDVADLFVLASRTEGLPRAMVEAMARGLPCLGTNVGGIPELLPPEALVPSENSSELAARIRRLAADPSLMTQSAARSLERAADYRDSILNARRRALLSELRDQTERWLAGNSARQP